MRVICAHCGESTQKSVSAINRAKAAGNNLYCGRTCSGLGRRTGFTKAQQVERKREYDAEYRQQNIVRIKTNKAAHFKKTYDPQKAAVERQKTMHRHVEYCRRPEYRAKKKLYDREYRARKIYGEFWESFLLLQDVMTEAGSRMPQRERKISSGYFNKSQSRKRYEEATNR